jgi:hypothetical protein
MESKEYSQKEIREALNQIVKLHPKKFDINGMRDFLYITMDRWDRNSHDWATEEELDNATKAIQEVVEFCRMSEYSDILHHALRKIQAVQWLHYGRTPAR